MRVWFGLFLLALVSPAAAQDTLVAESRPPIVAAEVPEAHFDLLAAVAEGPALSVDEAVALAMDSSPSLAQSRALANAARAAVAEARTQMLPRLDLSAAYTHIDGFDDGLISLSDPESTQARQELASMVTDPAARLLWESQVSGAGVSIAVPRNRANFGARLSWPASDFFFAILPTVSASERQSEARQYEQEAAEAGVRRSAHEAYLNLVRARGAYGVAVEARRQTEARLEEVTASVRAGFLTAADRLAAESRVAQSIQSVESARAGVEVADAALRTLIGANDGEVYGVSLNDTLPVAVNYEDALDRRPELRALRAILASQRAAADASNASGYPHLSVFVGADYGNPNRYQVPPTQQWMPSWEVGASLSWSPNDTLSASHRGDRMSYEQSATEAQIEEMKRMIRLEVRQAQAELRAAQRGIEAAEAAVEAAESAYETRLAQLRAGNTTTAAVFDNERELNRSRLALLDARVQLQLSSVRLAYAGGLL